MSLSDRPRLPRSLVPLALGLALAGPAWAQGAAPCDNVPLASEAYFDARFDDAVQLLALCIGDAGASLEGRVSAYVLLGNVMLSLQREDRARAAVEGLLAISPSYTPDPDERAVFRDLVEEVRASLNRPPAVAADVPVQRLSQGGVPFVYSVSQLFEDPNGDALTYSAASSDPTVATAAVSGSMLTVTPVGEGEAWVTVTAEDPAGSSAEVSFRVAVSPRPIVVAQPDAGAPRPGPNPEPSPRRPETDGGGGMMKWVLVGGGAVAAGLAAVLLGGGGDGGGTTPPPAPDPGLPAPPPFPALRLLLW